MISTERNEQKLLDAKRERAAAEEKLVAAEEKLVAAEKKWLNA